jgi:hypothetical protein
VRHLPLPHHAALERLIGLIKANSRGSIDPAGCIYLYLISMGREMLLVLLLFSCSAVVGRFCALDHSCNRGAREEVEIN